MAAIMFPNVIRNAEKGEEQFYFFLRDKLSSNYLVWYENDIRDRFPDFIMLSPQTGIVIFEVKDWSVDNIKTLDGENCQLKNVKRGHSKRQSPIRQLREYKELLQQKIKHKEPKDKEKIPPRFINKTPIIRTVCVFPNITKDDFEKVFENGKTLSQVVDRDRAILKDDFERYQNQTDISTLIKSKLGKPELLSEKEIQYLRGCIDPSVIIDSEIPIVRMLDTEQEQIARLMPDYNVLIKGNAGSGKSIILHARAKYLSEREPDAKILLLCYNKSLCSNLRNTIFAGYPNIKVRHVDSGPDYKEFDYILIDEGQDIEPKHYEAIKEHKKDNCKIWVAADGAQNIYKRDYHFNDLGLNFDEKIPITKNYRSTAEIIDFAETFLNLPSFDIEKSQEFLSNKYISEVDASYRTGEKPIFVKRNNNAEMLQFVCEKIKELNTNCCSYGNIGILTFSSDKKQGVSKPQNNVIKPSTVSAALEKHRIPYTVINDDKENVNLTKNEVVISTIHSAKGMEFDTVFLLDFYNAIEYPKTMYVGLTRAVERLILCYTEENPAVEKLLEANESFQNKVSYKEVSSNTSYLLNQESHRINKMSKYIKDRTEELAERETALNVLENEMKETKIKRKEQTKQQQEIIGKLVKERDYLINQQAAAERKTVEQELKITELSKRIYQLEHEKNQWYNWFQAILFRWKNRGAWLIKALVICAVIFGALSAAYSAASKYIDAFMKNLAEQTNQEQILKLAVTGCANGDNCYISFETGSKYIIPKGTYQKGSEIEFFKKDGVNYVRFTGKCKDIDPTQGTPELLAEQNKEGDSYVARIDEPTIKVLAKNEAVQISDYINSKKEQPINSYTAYNKKSRGFVFELNISENQIKR